MLEVALQGVARFSQTVDERDDQLRRLLTDANQVTSVLADHSAAIVRMLTDSDALLAELMNQSRALDQISGNIAMMSQQITGLIAENRKTLQPALDKLNELLAVVDHRKERIAQAIKGFNQYAMSSGESMSSGPFFKFCIANLLRAVHPALRRRGLLRSRPRPGTSDPHPAHRPADRTAGHPPLPAPFPRTGQGGEPR